MGEGVGDRAVALTTCTSQRKEVHRKETQAGEGTARGSTILGQPTILGVDWRRSRTPNEMQGQ